MVETEETYSDRLLRALRRWIEVQDTAAQVAMVHLHVRSSWDSNDGSEPVILHELPVLELTELLDEDATARVGKALTGTHDSGIRYSASRMAYLERPRYHRHLEGRGLAEPLFAAELFSEVTRLAAAAAELVTDSGAALGRGLATGRLIETARDESAGVAEQLADKVERLRTILEEDVASLSADIQGLVGQIHNEAATVCAGTFDGPTLIEQAVLVYALPRTHGPGRYHVRVYAPTVETRLVVLGDLTDNRSTSLTNGIDEVAKIVSHKLLGDIASDRIIWATYDAAGQFGYSRESGSERDMCWISSFTDPDALSGFRLGPCTHEELETLAGGPVRRWHVRDYTSDLVHEEGARMLRIPRHRPIPSTDLPEETVSVDDESGLPPHALQRFVGRLKRSMRRIAWARQ